MEEECQRCGETKELVPNMVICSDCSHEIIEKSWGKQYHPIEVAKKLDEFDERLKRLEARPWIPIII